MNIYTPSNRTDIELVKKFMTSIIEDEFGYKINKEWHSDILRLKDVYLNSKSILYIAKEDDKIVGTIAGRPYDRVYPEFADRYNCHNTYGVWRHYVSKDMRGLGIGTQLLESFVSNEKITNSKYLYLHTQKTIAGSLEYWVSKGFDITWDVGDIYKTVHLEKVLK